MALALLSILVTNPSFYAGPPDGWRIVLAVCYLVALPGLTLDRGRTIPARTGGCASIQGLVLHPWRAVALWAALLALSVTMFALNDNFVWLIWIPFGMSLSLLPCRAAWLLVVPTVTAGNGLSTTPFQTSFSPSALLQFAGLPRTCRYSAIIYHAAWRCCGAVST